MFPGKILKCPDSWQNLQIPGMFNFGFVPKQCLLELSPLLHLLFILSYCRMKHLKISVLQNFCVISILLFPSSFHLFKLGEGGNLIKQKNFYGKKKCPKRLECQTHY